MKIDLTSDKSVYNFCEPYIIAEIGANHNGEMDLARKMIDSAVACGSDAVKFQSWTPESLIAREEYDCNQKYDDSAKKHFGSLREMVERYYLREEQHEELCDYCNEKNVDFVSTPFSIKEVDLLMRFKVPYVKVASMDLNQLNLLRYVAQQGKPVLLSTGMGTLGEIEQAILTVESEGNTQIILLHCISIYPPQIEDIHLRNITMLQETFGYPVGFSDHTIGTSIPLASVALGACVIEKHFTTDKNLPGWDHEISADPDELTKICRESKNINHSLGNLRRIVTQAENKKKKKFRRSAVAIGDLKAGDIIQADDIAYKRPGTAISPDEEKYLIGRRLKKPKSTDDLFQWSDFE